MKTQEIIFVPDNGDLYPWISLHLDRDTAVLLAPVMHTVDQSGEDYQRGDVVKLESKAIAHGVYSACATARLRAIKEAELSALSAGSLEQSPPRIFVAVEASEDGLPSYIVFTALLLQDDVCALREPEGVELEDLELRFTAGQHVRCELAPFGDGFMMPLAREAVSPPPSHIAGPEPRE
jgi:hypothetical protein